MQCYFVPNYRKLTSFKYEMKITPNHKYMKKGGIRKWNQHTPTPTNYGLIINCITYHVHKIKLSGLTKKNKHQISYKYVL